MDWNALFEFVTHLLLSISLGWYLITNLQWYSYKIERVMLKHHKVWWHVVYFLIPFLAYHLTGEYFWIFFYFGILPSIALWNHRLDKKLVLTWRVKRFLALLVVLVVFQDFLCFLSDGCLVYGLFMPLAVAYIGSQLIEWYISEMFKRAAQNKLKSMRSLKIIAITGSYGKTSIKQFLTQVLANKYKVYATPRSVNTLGGIIRDINEELDEDTQIYIVEAGARENGDIAKITQLLNQHYAIVGKVGPQHLEYFKTLENIIRTKLEIVQSFNLLQAYVHHSVTNEARERVSFYGEEISDVKRSLEGTKFSLKLDDTKFDFETKVLGAFQADNIAAVIHMAKRLHMSIEEIQSAVKKLKPVEHRLERIDAGGKIILDDGFNGNIDGMLEGIELSKLHYGRKVIITPGLVESTEELNLKLIEEINKVFELVIVTGSLNSDLFDKHLKVPNKIILKEKSQMEIILGQVLKEEDLVFFANDAPNFI